MYDELVEALRLCVKYGKGADVLANALKAADAIEELSKKRESACWGCKCEKIEPSRWIPVTEENHPKAYEPVMVVYIGWNDALPHRDCTAYWSEDEDLWRWANTDDKVKVPITHYMPLPPLPDPPKEAEQ